MRSYSPGGSLNALTAAQQGSIPATPSDHRLLRGLPGYLILFAPHAFAPQRQYWSRKSPSPPVFLLISTNFTSTPGIPLPSPILKSTSCRVLINLVTQLTREVDRLGSTVARLKLKGIDGGPHKRWSMWFNSTQREEPYLVLTSREFSGNS